jgi:hypothetical protein
MVAQTQTKLIIMTQYIGLSLSMCIQDLIEGKLGNDAQVLVIIAGTMFTNEDTFFEDVYELYSNQRSYWTKYTKEQVKSAFDSVKIVQPRIYGQMPPNISDGHWVTL